MTAPLLHPTFAQPAAGGQQDFRPSPAVVRGARGLLGRRHTGDDSRWLATGRRFAYEQMPIGRMRNGRGVEHWAVRDDAALMRQLTGTSGSSHHKP